MLNFHFVVNTWFNIKQNSLPWIFVYNNFVSISVIAYFAGLNQVNKKRLKPMQINNILVDSSSVQIALLSHITKQICKFISRKYMEGEQRVVLCQDVNSDRSLPPKFKSIYFQSIMDIMTKKGIQSWCLWNKSNII